MADASHLEKMGRELKCPICLSLLNSSVSLTCNHVFCNSCIMKSMKSGSNCPVCKVPFQRREVRPAPHMDNLVNIYKSMEVASGINIFVTQNVPTTKLSDSRKEPESDPNYEEDNQEICPNQVENKKAFMGRKRRKTTKHTPQNRGTVAAKPSFPTKKRVQVSQYPLQETPTRPAKVEGCLGETSVDRYKITSTLIKEKPVPNEKGESTFTPFFWLRDEDDAEKVSQRSDSNQFMDMPTPDVPSFSDIKDSDDENPKLTPEEALGESNDADFIDSGMFDWTQRACSPELCSSPMKVQETAVLQSLKGVEEPSTGYEEYLNTNQRGYTDVVLPHASSPRIKDADNQIERKKSNKRARKIIQRTHKKCAKRTKAETSEIHIDPKEGSINLVEDGRAGNRNDSSVNIEEINTGMGADFDLSACKQTPENASTGSAGKEKMNQCNKNIVIELPKSSGDKSRGSKKLNVKESGNICKKINHRMHKDSPAWSKKQKLHSENLIFEEPVIGNQINDDDIPQLSLPVFNDINVSGIRGRACKQDGEIKSSISLRSNQRSRCKKVSFIGSISRVGLGDGKQVQGNVSKMLTQVAEPVEMVQKNSAVIVRNASSTFGKPPCSNSEVLRKCKSIDDKVECAFCHSSEVSEASGEMVHFCDGMPVAEDYNGGSKVIHSHKNCAEWAPNVYFEGDTAINLEAELTRSRRIPCSCCGIKGAALGCYEKSCRKSFHVPCAKLTPQCRWDSDKFVMLCPLHPSSKFTETSGSHKRGRTGCKAKKQQCTQGGQVAMKYDINKNQNWNHCGSPKKLVLCCSALTVADKEIISVFKELSGVTELKKWDSTVTHVVASTDENGACRRTLKILKGILEGKWILSIEWVKACMKAMKPVNEESYEITNIHGTRDGPRLGRLRLQNQQPKLFNGLMFYLMGDFMLSYKGYLQELIIAAGGSILHRKPIPRDHETILGSSFSTFIIYSKELPDNAEPSNTNMLLKQRECDAKALASSTGTKVASNSWVLDSIAASKLLNLSE